MMELNPFSEELDSDKYRSTGETFKESRSRVANSLSDSEVHYRAFRDILLDGRFWPGGRVLAAMGSLRRVTPYNCFVSGQIYDNFTDSGGIMPRASQAAITMRMGGGIGYGFSSIRPRGDLIKSLDAKASGPISFMHIYDAVCKAIRSAGHRRGAQMGVLRVDHPDIVEFIHAKQNRDDLTAFNLSVGITDEFMKSLKENKEFSLKFKNKVYSKVSAHNLWDMIMRMTYDWAEPGVLFLDTINNMNNLYYCEDIVATNPCGEQPLPPFGACLLGSFNLTRYIVKGPTKCAFDINKFKEDIKHVVRAMDNVVDRALYPLPEQEAEAQSKRRMGLGVMGVANALEIMGYEYGSPNFIDSLEYILGVLRGGCYETSVELAEEKGHFPLFDRDKYMDGRFIATLPDSIKDGIAKHGIRNSHLLSIAPTGTISLVANNVSSGIEPVAAYQFDRIVQTFEGPKTVAVKDYAWDKYGVKGKTIKECTTDDHLAVLIVAQKYMDSSVSKTINTPKDISWEEFKGVYMKAWEGGAKGCTTYRFGCKREGILKLSEDDEVTCTIDPESGIKECG